MARTVSVHSFRGGTGKSNLTANLAVLAARDGQRVAVVDTDIQSPGVHVLFGVDPGADGGRTLNDYLWGRCAVVDAAVDVGPGVGLPADRLALVPSSPRSGEIAKVLREGYDVGLLADGFTALREALGLDLLLVDTHPGVNEETLLSVTVSDTLVVVLRPDRQDLQGTAVTVEIARRLEVPDLRIVVNKMPASLDAEQVRRSIEDAYHAPVAGVLPHDDELMALASEGVFVQRRPDHPLAGALAAVARQILPPD